MALQQPDVTMLLFQFCLLLLRSIALSIEALEIKSTLKVMLNFRRACTTAIEHEQYFSNTWKRFSGTSTKENHPNTS
eukprot:scaffold1561_cov129-Cylindrotheca_fusiformis.AAC.2